MNFFLCITAFAIFLIAYIVGLSKKDARPFAREVLNCVLSVGILMLWNALMLIVTQTLALAVFYALFELTHLWVIASVIRISVAVCRRPIPAWLSKASLILGIADVVSFVVNFFTEHLYVFNVVDGKISISYMPWYETHRILMYAYCAFLIFTLVARLRMVYYIYWPRYVILLAGSVYMVSWDITGSYFMEHAFMGHMGYVVAMAAMYLLVMAFRSKLLRAYEYSEAIDTSSQHILMFDNLGECVMASKGAMDFFDIHPFYLNKAEDIINSMLDEPIPDDAQEFSKTCKYYKDDVRYYIRLDYRKLLKNGKNAGSIYGFTNVTEEMLELKEQRRLARYDSFTMIYDRNWLFSVIEEELINNPDKDYYIIGSDIRDFKVFNDVFGKDTGDMVITHIADVLRKLHSEGSIVNYGRIYADRFGMLAEKETYSEDSIVKEFLAIDHPFKEDYYHLNIHFGIYPTSLDRDLPIKSMFDRAFVALDSIKNEINIRTYHYNAIMRDEKVWEQTISANIEHAINEGQLRIVVQPQVNRNEEVIGGEALVRWRHPVNGEISPGEFIPVLEKTGLVTSADMHVWEESCKLLRRWKDLGFDNYYISVNVSATDFMFADIYAIFTGLVEKYDIDPKNLKLEITESAMMTDVLERVVLIKRLEERGFSVELDDFGSGYSSLNMLKEIPVDVIKMDMQFLYNNDSDSTANSKKIIGHIIHMAKDLNMEIVAEGVETKEQLTFLRDIGCDTFQGYYFSRPVEIEDFEREQGIA